MGWIGNPDITKAEFGAEFTVGPETEPKVAYYLTSVLYVRGKGQYRLLCVHFKEKTR